MTDDIFDVLDQQMEVLGLVAGPRRTSTGAATNWVPICVCGHPAALHGRGIGGTPIDGMDSDGCRGASPGRGAPVPQWRDGSLFYEATCPCRALRVVAEIDRPGRMMRQKAVVADGVHPFARGLRALRTRIGRMRTITVSPEQEFEDRFRWIAAEHRCDVCGIDDATVVPAFTGAPGRISEMRCKLHWGRP